MSLPQAVPRVNLAVVQVILLASVENKLSLMGPIFLWGWKKNNTRHTGSDKVVEAVSQRMCSCPLTNKHER